MFELVTSQDLSKLAVVDVGAGEGHFCRKLGEYVQGTYGLPPARILRACDLFPDQFKYEAIRCDPADINDRLPYPDRAFDIVCSIEVIEHLENQFAFTRELYRICREDGRVLITTPNILNIGSRLSYFYAGFWSLFRPLPIETRDPVHVSGHINPVSFYYLAYMLRKAGFQEVRLHFDRLKKSGCTLTLFFYPLIRLPHLVYLKRLALKRPEIYLQNAAILRQMNTWRMLASRTVIVEGLKRDANARTDPFT